MLRGPSGRVGGEDGEKGALGAGDDTVLSVVSESLSRLLLGAGLGWGKGKSPTDANS